MMSIRPEAINTIQYHTDINSLIFHLSFLAEKPDCYYPPPLEILEKRRRSFLTGQFSWSLSYRRKTPSKEIAFTREILRQIANSRIEQWLRNQAKQTSCL